jgi:hypothetical protein
MLMSRASTAKEQVVSMHVAHYDEALVLLFVRFLIDTAGWHMRRNVIGVLKRKQRWLTNVYKSCSERLSYSLFVVLTLHDVSVDVVFSIISTYS